MVVSCIPFGGISVFAETASTIKVEDSSTLAGTTVNVNVVLENNPGIAGAKIKIAYDGALTLTAVANGTALAELDYVAPALNNPCYLNWDSLDQVSTSDGVIAILTFAVPEGTAAGEFEIACSYVNGDIYDTELNDLSFNTVSGKLTVVDYIPGDANSDGAVNGKDVTVIRRYNAGYSTEISLPAADPTADGVINGKDVTLIRRYNAGYDVILLPSPIAHTHKMELIPAKAATCAEEGNIECWHCTLCDKYFDNENGTTLISEQNTVIPVTDEHTPIIDEAVPATTTSTGLTEGSHCSVCDKVLVAQVVIPIIEGYSITYKPSYTEEYLQAVDFNSQITDEQRFYNSEEGIYDLPILEAEGFDFVGWFDGSSSSATKITEIPAGSKGNKTLYAHWDAREYTITFDSQLISVSSVTNHTIDKASTLPGADVMNLYGYRWLGWSDENGVLYESTYPVGKTGNVTLHANWQSYRNQAVPVEKLAEPKVMLDEAAGKYLFTFDLGTINNVPLYTINDFGKMIPGQPVVKEEVTISKALSEEEGTRIAETIANSTVRTSTWSLANQWNKIASVSEGHTIELGIDSSTIEYDFESDTTNIGIYADAGESKNETVNWGVNAKVYGKNTMETGGSLSFPIKCVDVGVSAKNTTEIGGELGGYYDKTTVNDSYWNTKTAYDNSSASTHALKTENNLSQHVRDEYKYETTESIGETETNSEAVSASETESKEYSTSVAYKTEVIEATSYVTEYTTDIEGWWRQIVVGKIHVIGVVSYDIRTSTYSVYTYNVLDKKTEKYMDFSRTSGDYNDYETGVIPFEVPYSIHEYISYALGYSNGLEVDSNGVITDYPEDVEHVHIPDYITTDNGDGTYSAKKVIGIAPGLFAGNTTVKSVRLGKYTASIPENAFNGCTALKTVEFDTISSIGNNAFAGCVSLGKFTVSSSVTSLGASAFSAVPEVTVNAGNSSVVASAVGCGAEVLSIYLNQMDGTLSDVTLVVPEATNTFALYGRKNDTVGIYNNLSIESSAKTTIINGITFADNSKICMRLSSENVSLQHVSAQNASGMALVLSADTTKLSLLGETTFETSGTVLMLSKSVAVEKCAENTGSSTKTLLTLNNGKALYYGTFTDEQSLISGDIDSTTEEEYNNYSTGLFTVIFDPNGGEVSQTSKEVIFGVEFGELPTPTKEGYTFEGWYTSDEKLITATSVVDFTKNITLTAKWTAMDITYNVVYVSSNGTELGTSEVTFAYGTTNVIAPNGFAGYDTPESQTVVWDTADSKTITFTYTPSAVAATRKSGNIYVEQYGSLQYIANIEYRNRTADSVEIRVVWTATLSNYGGYSGIVGTGSYNQFSQNFIATSGSASTGNVTVVPWGSWQAAADYDRSATAASNWMTVSLNTTNATSVNVSLYYWQANYNGTDLSGSGYANFSATWAVGIPAF